MIITKFFDELTTTELYEILKSRSEVFMIGQNIHYLDMDDTDYDSLHCFYMENGRVTGYLRAFSDVNNAGVARVGRVLALQQKQGTGSRLMQESEPFISEELKVNKIRLDSQKHAVGFYEKLGYTSISDVFIEAGIEHVEMEKSI